jgi:hypothetical protein
MPDRTTPDRAWRSNRHVPFVRERLHGQDRIALASLLYRRRDWRLVRCRGTPPRSGLTTMYTVIRFIAGSGCSSEQLRQAGEQLNNSIPGAFKRFDRIGGRFSVSISTGDTWDVHEVAIAKFIHAATSVVAEARLNEISVEIDVAIEPEDVIGKAYLSVSMSPIFLEQLGSRGVTLGFTFSNPNP